MQRITCKTAELAVKKSYPICRDKYYPVQYSYGDSVKGKMLLHISIVKKHVNYILI